MVRKYALVPLLLSVILSGCLHTAVGMSPSSEPLAPDSYEKLGPVSGSDCLWKLLGLIPFTTGNTLQGAMRDALGDRSGTDALVQVTADSFIQFWIVVSRECTQVDGVAVKKR